jgi:hypothetical protein
MVRHCGIAEWILIGGFEIESHAANNFGILGHALGQIDVVNVAAEGIVVLHGVDKCRIHVRHGHVETAGEVQMDRARQDGDVARVPVLGFRRRHILVEADLIVIMVGV